ncbi:MAG: hypothetical protein HYV34_03735 [Candidatus Kerfeldbacteria bacterium]|nr:hypothetical protein [Candidatus Kerfeldbacteria bacterium]
MERLVDILPPDLHDGLRPEWMIEIPEWAFTPDDWTFAFQRGLRTIQWGRRLVWEVGVGTGINAIVARARNPHMRLRISDLSPRVTELAVENLRRTVGLENVEVLNGSWDLVTDRRESCAEIGKVDAVVACIPQVPMRGMDLSVCDLMAHYYNPERYTDSPMHDLGLGLNDSLLIRAHHVLVAGGHTVLNLCGRPGLNRLVQMFDRRGYTPRELHRGIIPQHIQTSIASLAELEVQGHSDFEFFSDMGGRDRIDAYTAEERRLRCLAEERASDIYHAIYVIEGVLRT